jgi:ABC-2 type transport system ATP-binding protein
VSILISARRLKKSYGYIDALDGLDLEVRGGEVFGLFGPNASGKTTAIKVLFGLARPEEGEATVAGVDVLEDPLRVRSVSAAMIENPPQFAQMRVNEYLRFHARMAGLPRSTESHKVYETISDMGLDEEALRPVGELSLGQRQKVELARVFLNGSRVLFLDEPFSNLDIESRQSMRERLRAWLDGDRCVLYTSHNLLESEGVVDRFAFIHRGRKVAEGTRSELLERFLRPTFYLTTSDPAKAMKIMGGLPEVVTAELVGGSLMFEVRERAQTAAVFSALVREAVSVYGIRPMGSMEEIFAAVVLKADPGVRQLEGPNGGKAS